MNSLMIIKLTLLHYFIEVSKILLYFHKSCCVPWDTVRKNFKGGDIVNVDVTAFKEGWHGDTSRMFKVGEVSIKAEKLIKCTYESMMRAISVVKDGSI